jgi:addiction module HigA family antidote
MHTAYTNPMNIHPGELLKDAIDELGLSLNAAAEHLKIDTNRLSQITRGRRAISPDTAVRLERWLGTSAKMWLNLQNAYELAIARQQLKDVEIVRLATT